MDESAEEIRRSFEDDLVDVEEVARLFKAATDAGMDREAVRDLVDEAMIAMSVLESTPIIFQATTPARLAEATSDLRSEILKRL